MTGDGHGVLDRTDWRMLVAGEWVGSQAGTTFDSLNPATGEKWTVVPDGDEADVDRAVRSAQMAFETSDWRHMTATARGDIVRRIAETVADHADELAQLETRESGKLLRETRALLAYVPRFYEYYAGLADKIEGKTFPLDKPDMLAYSTREPLGVVAMILPWNSPNYLTAMKLAPALVTGNTVVIKPSEHAATPLLRLAELCHEVGLPPGVLNVVTGSGAATGSALASHRLVRRIAFTGGTETGRQIVARSTENLARLSLELGGKSANIIFADADLDNAITGIIAGIFAASGQSCVAGSRILVHESIAQEVTARLIERARSLRMGPPDDESTEMGPLALHAQIRRVSSILDSARSDGATVVSGGTWVDGIVQPGWYLPPTVVTNPGRSDVITQELFAPVASILTFGTEAEAVGLANSTEFGLAAGVWTSDIGRAHRVAASLSCGMVWVNTYRVASPMVPVGGRGNSGYGMEAGIEGIESYLATKSIWVNLSEGSMPDPFVMR